MEPDDKIWKEGKAAAASGQRLDSNPYRFRERILTLFWERGWKNMPVNDIERIEKFCLDIGYGPDECDM
jgi:hypothetical protein